MNRGQAGALDRVGDVRAQVGIDDVRADDVEQHGKLVLGDPADLEDAGLLRLDEEQGLVAHLRGDGERHDALVDAVGDGLAAHVELDLDLGTLLLEEDLRRMRHLEREILQVDTLDRENRILGLLGHFGSWLGAGCSPAGLRAWRASHGNQDCSSGASSPRRSSAWRSSQPPTWTSPMKICGTVVRPERWTISRRRSGSSSRSMIRGLETPRAASSASARWQNGHQAVR